MVKCPNCGEEIDKLICVQTVVETSELTVQSDEPGDYMYDNYVTDGVADLSEEPNYVCPKCNENVVYGESCAVAFLLDKPYKD